MKIRVEAVHFDADIKLIDFIKKKLSKIEQFYDQILDVSVSLKLEKSLEVISFLPWWTPTIFLNEYSYGTFIYERIIPYFSNFNRQNPKFDE